MAHLLCQEGPCLMLHLSRIPFSSLSMALLGVQLEQQEMRGSCCGLNVKCLSPLPKAHIFECLAPSW